MRKELGKEIQAKDAEKRNGRSKEQQVKTLESQIEEDRNVSTSQADPPENYHLNVKKLSKTCPFFQKKLPKIVIFPLKFLGKK